MFKQHKLRRALKFSSALFLVSLGYVAIVAMRDPLLQGVVVLRQSVSSGGGDKDGFLRLTVLNTGLSISRVHVHPHETCRINDTPDLVLRPGQIGTIERSVYTQEKRSIPVLIVYPKMNSSESYSRKIVLGSEPNELTQASLLRHP